MPVYIFLNKIKLSFIIVIADSLSANKYILLCKNTGVKMTDPTTLTKLIVMYMLDMVDFPLKKAQLFDFILEKEYTNYFTLQTAINDLIESNFIETSSTHSTTFVSLTDSGRDTLKLFKNRISDGIINDISKYFNENKMTIHNEVSAISNYYRTSNGFYVADLVARENSNELINLKVFMPTEDAAESICSNWKEKSQDIYAYIIENLL